jgi:hypothetical protein
VDQNIEAAKIPGNLIDAASAIFGIAHVGLHKADVEASCAALEL